MNQVQESYILVADITAEEASYGPFFLVQVICNGIILEPTEEECNFDEIDEAEALAKRLAIGLGLRIRRDL